MKVRLLATSDIHGYLMPINYANNDYVDQGFLSILNTINEYKTDNTLLIDDGDTIQGSPFMTYYYEHKQGSNPINLCLKDYDYVNIGNHDFNYGKDELKKYINDLGNKYICGNVKIDGINLGKEYIIHEFDKDNKIAIIGCTSKCVLAYESKEHVENVEVEDCYEYVKRVIDKIKETEDVKAIVVIYHGGLEADFDGNLTETDTGENQGYKMCRDLDFDILISGHQHRSLNNKLFNKVVTQCGANGKEFALIDFDLDSKESSSQLIKPKGYDTNLYEEFLPLENEVNKWLDETIGVVENVDLKITDGFKARLFKHPLISFINEAQRDLVNADLSGTALFNGAIGFNCKISIRDLVSTYIYENYVYKVKINGKQLKEYLEVNARYFDLKDDEIVVSEDYLIPVERHFNYDMVDGIDYVIKVSNPRGKRIISMKYQGKDIKEDDEFSLAISNFRYGGSGGFDVFKDLELLQMSDEDMVKVLMNYLKKNEITIVDHKENIEVIK